MFFASTQANIVLYLSVASVVLWVGPGRLVPGYTASLPLAATSHGRARGEVWSSRDGAPFSVWRGLRYALPPTGGRRFQRPEPLGAAEAWAGERDFTTEMPRCYQLSPVGGFHSGQEDCLFLNVYTPVVPDTEELLPVMVWIHGGGFVSGDAGSTLTGPHFLMDEGVVVVTLNYRLGILGFLTTEQEDAPGNLGLWDQRQALLWVRENIAGFGGDPGQVTLFGESAGSMAINFHLVSPQSRGLFHRAVMQSGTAISLYTRARRPPAQYAREVAAAAGCGPEAALACLRKLPVRKLQLHLQLFDNCSVRADLGLASPGPWVPWVDAGLAEPFLPLDPETALRTGEDSAVPVMIGFTTDEGLLYTGRFHKDPAFLERFLEDWDTCGPINFLGRDPAEVTPGDRERVAELRAGYPPGTPGLTAMFTDAVFAASSHQATRLLAARGRTVYRYLFAYRGSHSLADIAFSGLRRTAGALARGLLRLAWGTVEGAAHGDDIIYLFQVTPVLDLLPAAPDLAVSRSMAGWWAAFARGGPPDPAWPPARPEGYSYWVIDTQPGVREREELARLERWL